MEWHNSAANPEDLIEFSREQLLHARSDGTRWACFCLALPGEVCGQLTTLVAAHSNNPEMALDVHRSAIA